MRKPNLPKAIIEASHKLMCIMNIADCIGQEYTHPDIRFSIESLKKTIEQNGEYMREALCPADEDSFNQNDYTIEVDDLFFAYTGCVYEDFIQGPDKTLNPRGQWSAKTE